MPLACTENCSSEFDVDTIKTYDKAQAEQPFIEINWFGGLPCKLQFNELESLIFTNVNI